MENTRNTQERLKYFSDQTYLTVRSLKRAKKLCPSEAAQGGQAH